MRVSRVSIQCGQRERVVEARRFEYDLRLVYSYVSRPVRSIDVCWCVCSCVCVCVILCLTTFSLSLLSVALSTVASSARRVDRVPFNASQSFGRPGTNKSTNNNKQHTTKQNRTHNYRQEGTHEMCQSRSPILEQG